MVAEDVGLQLVCVEIVSEDTLVEEAVVDIVSRDGSATSSGMYLSTCFNDTIYTASSVYICTSYDTDHGPADFSGLSATVTFMAGASHGTSQCVCVTILEDNISEVTEVFSLSVVSRSPNVRITSGDGMISITDVCKCVITKYMY